MVWKKFLITLLFVAAPAFAAEKPVADPFEDFLIDTSVYAAPQAAMDQATINAEIFRRLSAMEHKIADLQREPSAMGVKSDDLWSRPSGFKSVPGVQPVTFNQASQAYYGQPVQQGFQSFAVGEGEDVVCGPNGCAPTRGGVLRGGGFLRDGPVRRFLRR